MASWATARGTALLQPPSRQKRARAVPSGAESALLPTGRAELPATAAAAGLVGSRSLHRAEESHR